MRPFRFIIHAHANLGARRDPRPAHQLGVLRRPRIHQPHYGRPGQRPERGIDAERAPERDREEQARRDRARLGCESKSNGGYIRTQH